MRNTPSGISAEIAKGVFRPHTALTNMALSYYQNAANYFARAIFSICPVGLSSDNYYIFDKEDLLRDNWQRKPAYGKVAPAVVSEHTDTYTCTGLAYDETTDIEQISKEFKELVTQEYIDAKKDGVLIYNQVRALITDIPGVSDFDTFLMNGKEENIVLGKEEYAATGDTNFS